VFTLVRFIDDKKGNYFSSKIPELMQNWPVHLKPACSSPLWLKQVVFISVLYKSAYKKPFIGNFMISR